MIGITDIHNHILYKVDDGSSNIEESMKMIDDEYAQGVRNIIFTPHYHGGEYEASQARIEERFTQVTENAKAKYPDMNFYIGQEILYSGDMIELIKSNRVRTMAGSKYVLIEFFPRIRYEDIERAVRQLMINGYVAIIAHAERYECLKGKVGRVHHLVETGAYIQVNADIVSTFSKRRFLKMLIDADSLHFVGTDAHDQTNRGVNFSKCINYLNKKYGEEYVEWLLIDNPQKVIEDQYI